MKRLSFKELVRQDVTNIFMNPDEFGEEHDINGRTIICIVDDNEMIEREKRQTHKADYKDGTYRKQVMLYVSALAVGPRPKLGSSLLLDQVQYVVTDAIDEVGIYSISLEATRG